MPTPCQPPTVKSFLFAGSFDNEAQGNCQTLKLLMRPEK